MKLLKFFLLFLFFIPPEMQAQVWPGDVNNNGIVNEVDLLYLGNGFGKEGPARKAISATWESQAVAANWPVTSALGEDFDLAYADCNGDGVINDEDIIVIQDNFGRTHGDVVFMPDAIPEATPEVSPAFSVGSNANLEIYPNTKTLSIPLNLGDATIPVDNLVGLTFYIKVNPEAFDPKETTFEFNGWLDDDNSRSFTQRIEAGRSGPGDLVVAYTKTNNLPASGNGSIGVISIKTGFIFEDDVPNFKISIDSIILIDNQFNKVPVFGTQIVFDAVGFRDSTTINSNICQGDALLFGGDTLSTPGTFRDTLMNSVGGDSILILNLSVLDTFQTTFNNTICQGDSFAFNGSVLSTAGTYRDTLTAVNGCDSFIVLNLIVADTFQIVINEQICNGDSFSFNGSGLSTAGTYRDTLTAVNGCDSFIVLNLIVTDTFQTVINEQICNGASFFFNGNNLSIPGTYIDTLTASNGCDSFIVLNLSIKENFETTIQEAICEGGQFDFEGAMLQTAGTYRDTLQAANGCDSVLILNLSIEDTLQTTLTQSICEGDNFLFNGHLLSTGGTYRDTQLTAEGCDQYIILELTVNDTFRTILDRTICEGDEFLFNDQMLTTEGTYFDTLFSPAGCRQNVVLNLTVNRPASTSISATICGGESFAFDNQELRTNGFYEQVLIAANGCDSVISLSLNVLTNSETSLNQTICQGENFSFNNQALSQSGVYSDTLTAANGCDSVLFLSLIVAQNPETTINQTICLGSTYSFNGQALLEAGVYFDTLNTVNGCDSFLTLNLKTSDRYETELNQTICEGSTASFSGTTISTPGTYQETFVAVNGCDSLVTLNLTVSDVAKTVLVKEICQGSGMLFNGRNLTSNGIYYDTLRTMSGCDSLIELNLAVLPVRENMTNQTICRGDTLQFHGFVLTTANSYMVTLQTPEGCDSMVVLNLSVAERVETSISQTICTDESYLFDGNELTEAGIYTQALSTTNGCDSVIVLDLVVHEARVTNIDTTLCPGDNLVFGNMVITEAGTYTQTLVASNGCDSAITLNVTMGAAGIGVCMSVGIEEELLESIQIRPNPVSQNLFILSPDVKMHTIQLINLTGQILEKRSFQSGNHTDRIEINMQNFTPGVYWVLIQTEYGLRQEKIVKF